MRSVPAKFLFFTFVVVVGGTEFSTNLSSQQIAKSLGKIIIADWINVGCIGLYMDETMVAREKSVLFSLRLQMKDSHLPVMVVSNRDVERAESSLCRRQRTLLVALYPSPGVLHQLHIFFNSTTKWQYIKWLLILSSAENSMSEEEWLDTQFPMDVTYDTSLFIIKGNQLLDVFRYNSDQHFKIVNLGKFEKTNEEFEWIKTRKWINLDGINIKIAVKNTSASRIQKLDNGTIILKNGVYVTIWKLLKDKLNFTYEIEMTEKHGWLVRSFEKTWPEIESLALDGSVDAIVTELIPSAEKNMVLFLTMPIYWHRYYILVQDPISNVYINWDIFTAPFSNWLWATVLLTICGVSITLYFMNKFFGYRIWKEEYYRYNFFNCSFSIFRAFCNQGQEFDPKAVPIQIIFITTYFTAMLIISSYSGVLISFLTTGKSNLPFGSLEEIINDGSYQVGMKLNSSIYLQFESAPPGSKMREVFVKLISKYPENVFQSYEEGVKRVCKMKYAMIVSLASLQYVKHHKPCKLSYLKPVFLNCPLVIGFSPKFRFISLFSNLMKGFKSQGIISKINQEGHNMYRLKGERLDSPSVDITQVTPLLVELAIAIALSFLFLLLERIINSKLLSLESNKVKKRKRELNVSWIKFTNDNIRKVK